MKVFFARKAAAQAEEAQKKRSNRKLRDDVIAVAVGDAYEDQKEGFAIGDDTRDELGGLAIILNALEGQLGVTMVVNDIIPLPEWTYAEVSFVYPGVQSEKSNLTISVWAPDEEANELFFAYGYSLDIFLKKKKASNFYDANVREVFFEKVGKMLGTIKSEQAYDAKLKALLDGKRKQARSLNKGRTP